MYTEIKYVKDGSCVGHLGSVNLVTNAPPVVMDPPVGARLHNFGEKWEALGSSPKVVTTLREGYTLPFRFRPNLTRSPDSPTVISNYHNPSKQAHLLEALYQLVNNKTTAAVCISRRVPQGKKYYIEIFPLCIGHCCTILQVKNSLETALSVMLFEILTLFIFSKNPRWLPKVAKNEIFPLWTGHSCITLRVKKSLEIARSVTVFEILLLFHFPQKCKMAAKSGEN